MSDEATGVGSDPTLTVPAIIGQGIRATLREVRKLLPGLAVLVVWLATSWGLTDMFAAQFGARNGVVGAVAAGLLLWYVARAHGGDVLERHKQAQRDPLDDDDQNEPTDVERDPTPTPTVRAIRRLLANKWVGRVGIALILIYCFLITSNPYN